MPVLKNVRYDQVVPLGDSTGDAFRGELDFSWTLSSTDRMDASSLYLNTTIEITHNTQNATPAWVESVLPAEWGISPHPSGCMYSSAHLRANNTEASRVDDFSSASYYHDITRQSAQKLTNNQSVNPIYFNKRYNNAGSTLADVATNARNALSVNPTATGAKRISLCQHIPMFIGSDDIAGNVSYQLKLLVEQNYENGVLFRSDGATPNTVKGIVRGDANAPAFGATNDTYIRVKVVDVTLNYMAYQDAGEPKSTETVLFTEYETTTRPVTSINERYNITLPKNAKDVALFFRPTDGHSNSASSPNMFTANVETSANALLRSYEVSQGGHTYPSPKYDLRLLAGDSDRRDNGRAFMEYAYYMSDMSPNGNAHDQTSWTSNPILYHPLTRISGDLSNNCDIQLQFSAVPANSQLVIISSRDKKMDIEYDDNGMVKDVKLEDII